MRGSLTDRCACLHRRALHQVLLVESGGHRWGHCLQMRCPCAEFCTEVATTECASCEDGQQPCTCGEAEETCEECGHWASDHGDAGCGTRDYECDCMVGALVPEPDCSGCDDCIDPATDGLAEVAYALDDGRRVVVRVPRGVTVDVHDGMLQLAHVDGAVVGIVRVRT